MNYQRTKMARTLMPDTNKIERIPFDKRLVIKHAGDTIMFAVTVMVLIVLAVCGFFLVMKRFN